MNIILSYRSYSLRVLFFLLPFIFMSCFQENEYKTILDNYVKEDVAFNEHRKDYELASLKNLAEERPREVESMYKEAEQVNAVVSEFEKFLLKAEHVDSINSELKIIQDKISKLKLKHYSFLEEGFNIEPLKALSEKYELITTLKNLNFDRYNTIWVSGCDLSTISSYKPKLLASRLNDSIVVLNVYSRLLRDYNRISDEQPKLDVTINKEISANTFVGIHVKPQTSSAAYLIKSKSDTLFVDAMIKSNNMTKLIISKNSSYVTVGELKTFDENYLQDYFKKTYN